jgi:hypothetical protein
MASLLVLYVWRVLIKQIIHIIEIVQKSLFNVGHLGFGSHIESSTDATKPLFQEITICDLQCQFISFS